MVSQFLLLISSMRQRRDITHTLTCLLYTSPKDLGITELVYYPVLAQLMEEHTDIDDLKEAIKKNVHCLLYTSNMSVLGYDLPKVYEGRGPL